MRALLQRLTKTHPGELAAVLAAFCMFFTLLAAYYVLRPLRDEMAMQLGPNGLQRLFDAVFLAMVAAVPAFGWLVRRFPRREVLPWVYGFFVLDLLVFYALMVETGPQRPLVARAFFVWVTVFSATGVSVFWSLMADLFTTAQAKRLYGFIAAGGASGAIIGPLVTVALVHLLGPRQLVLVAGGLLSLTGVATGWVRRAAERLPQDPTASTDPKDRAPEVPPPAMASSVWSGVADIFRSPLLLGICAFLLIFSLLSTLLYFRTAELLPRLVASSAQRTSLLAKLDGAVNVLAFALQLFVFPRAVARGGVRAVLVAMPVLSVFGFLVVAWWPTLWPLLVVGVCRRAGEFALSKPGREMLFNGLTPDEKYKAKNVIDTLVYRSGDELSSRAFTGLRAVGVTPQHMLWSAVPLSLLWTWLAWKLGQPRHGLRATADESPPRTAAGT